MPDCDDCGWEFTGGDAEDMITVPSLHAPVSRKDTGQSALLCAGCADKPRISESDLIEQGIERREPWAA